MNRLSLINARASKGFTIVELLIVIVVIAILAAISIVAYNGIQERARMSSALAYASQVKRSQDILGATAVYSFDECSGSSVRDTSEHRNNGTIQGASWSTDTPNNSGCSLNFNGTNNQVTTPASIGTNFYIKMAWVKINNCSNANNIISTPHADSGAVIYNCNSLQAGHNGIWNSANTGMSIGDGKWHHIAVKYDNGVLEVFIDGKSRARATGVAQPTSLATVIGSYAGGNFFSGLMDDVVIISR